MIHLVRHGAALVMLLPVVATAQGRNVDWAVYGGTSDNTHYTTLNQITPANVSKLQVAWTYETHDEGRGTEMQANPIIIDGIMYAESPVQKIFALNAATGKELWKWDPSTAPGGSRGRGRHRGMVVTGDRILVTVGGKLWALDRKSGQPIASFGTGGSIDLRDGFDRPGGAGGSVSASTPGVVYQGLFIIGSTVAEALPGAPGDIRAFDVMTGKEAWRFHTIPHPGEFGYETWPPDAWKTSGGANAWAGVTIDEKHGILFAATGSPSFDWYGGDRIGDNLFANSVLALNAKTGKYIWHFQTVRHDLWDYDLPARPALVTVTRRGKPVEAVAQITKTGYVYVLDRLTGKSLFPLGEYKAPTSKLDGERTAATQPYPLLPLPFTRQHLTESMLTTRTPEAHAAALDLFKKYKSGFYEPAALEGNIHFPGTDGGGEWGGPAFDPTTALLYVNSNEQPWLQHILPRSDKSLYANTCAGCHGDDMKGSAMAPTLLGVAKKLTTEQLRTIIGQGTGRMPGYASLGNVTVNAMVNFLVTGKDVADSLASSPTFLKYRSSGIPLWQDPDSFPPLTPPWGTLHAIDLNSGKTKWVIPFGEYPKLVAQGIRNTGSDNYGSGIVTKNGLFIIAATSQDNKFHVYNKLTGKLIWETTLPAAGNATPSIYMVDGREYIVIACGGGKNGAKPGGTYVAFALPDAK